MGFFDEIGKGLSGFGQGLGNLGADFSSGGEPLGFDSIGDMFLNLITGGIVGVNDEGDIGFGAAVKAADEIVGEVSGRNIRREALGRQEDLLAEETVKREKLEAEERLFDEKQDRAASTSAPGGSRRRSGGTGGDPRQSGQSFQLGAQRDFLGL